MGVRVIRHCVSKIPSRLLTLYERTICFFRTNSAIEIHTDGSAKDGVGSWAYVISRRGKRLSEKSGCVPLGNCNVMEFQAAIEALSSLPANSTATVFSDSRIVVDAMKSGKGPPAFAAQMETLHRLIRRHTISWQWVKAHNANELNERCDQLCIQARRIPSPSVETR